MHETTTQNCSLLGRSAAHQVGHAASMRPSQKTNFKLSETQSFTIGRTAVKNGPRRLSNEQAYGRQRAPEVAQERSHRPNQFQLNRNNPLPLFFSVAMRLATLVISFFPRSRIQITSAPAQSLTVISNSSSMKRKKASPPLNSLI